MPKSMKKQVELVVGNFAIYAYDAECISIVGAPGKLKYIAFGLVPFCHDSYIHGEIVHMWCYRRVFVFKDSASDMPYCVVFGRGSVSRFSSLRAAKSAISRYMNKKGGLK